jgi:serine/threonine protein kinase
MGKTYTTCCKQENFDMFACNNKKTSFALEAGTPVFFEPSKRHPTTIVVDRWSGSTRSTLAESVNDMVSIEEDYIQEHYEFGQVLSSTDDCVTREGHVVGYPEEKVTIKIIQWEKVEEDHENILAQLKDFKKVDHPGITNLQKVFVDESYLYLVIERPEGVELYNYIVEKGSVIEEWSVVIIQQILSALKHLHSIGIKRTDLNMRNIMVDFDTLETKIVNVGIGQDF